MMVISASIAAIVRLSILVVSPIYGFIRLSSPLKWAFLAFRVSDVPILLWIDVFAGPLG